MVHFFSPASVHDCVSSLEFQYGALVRCQMRERKKKHVGTWLSCIMLCRYQGQLN